MDPCVRCETTRPGLGAILGPMMTGYMVSSLLVLFTCFIEIHADPSISTSTSTPCYGDVVTLVCHHPEVASNPGRYFSQPTAWRESGVGITPSTGVYLQTDTSEDLTSTTLTINITVDHFRNKAFGYSCILLLAGENGLPTGEVETSENVTVDSVDSPNKPHNITLTPGVNSINASWEHDRSCFESHVFKYIIICKEVGSRDSSENVIMNGTTFNIPGLKPGTYNICVLAVSTSDEQVKSKPECKTTSVEKGNTTAPNPDPTSSDGTPASVSPEVVIFLKVVADVVVRVLSDNPTADVVRLSDVATAVVLLVVRVLLALVCLVSIWQLFRRMRHENCETQASSVSEEQNGSSEEVLDQGQHRANRDQTRTVSQTSCQRTNTDTDAELDFPSDYIFPSSKKTREDLPPSKPDDSPPPDDDQGGSSRVANNNNKSEDFLTSVEEINPLPVDNCSEMEDFLTSVKEINPPVDNCSEMENFLTSVEEINPPVDDFYSESEDLPTSEQETTCPSDVQYCAMIYCGHGKIIEEDYSEKMDLMAIVHETSFVLTDDQCVKRVFPRLINNFSEKKDLMAIVHETSLPLPDDNHVKHVFPRLINDDSESKDLPTSEQESSPCDFGHEICLPGATNVYNKPLETPFRFTPCESSTVSAQCVPSDISGFLFSSIEYQIHDEEEEICHEREMSTSVHETQPPLPSIAASITNLKCMEEPLSTTTSVDSGEGPEMLPMGHTQSSHKCPDVPKADDSNINRELDSVSHGHTDVNDMQTLANSSMPEAVSDCVCMSPRCQICCAKESKRSTRGLIPSEPVTEEGKTSIQRTEFLPGKQTPTHCEKISDYLGSLETGQKPLHRQQCLRMLPGNNAESLQRTPKRRDVVDNVEEKSCCIFVPQLAYLFETVIHLIGALLVFYQMIDMNITSY